MRELTKKEIYYIVNHYIDTKQLLKSLHINVRANNAMFCPFHDNTDTPAAHLYKEEDGSYKIYCYSEDRVYSNADLYKNYLPEIDLLDLATLLYANLPEEEKAKMSDKINKPYELPVLPFVSALQDFVQKRITFKELLYQITKTLPYDDLTRVLNEIYNMGDASVKDIKRNKYLYFMNKYKTNYKFISASKLLISKLSLPEYLKDYLRTSGDSILIPNKINDTVYSLTFRNITGKKQFLKVGPTAHLFYGLGDLPEDFTYGIPIVIVEGNMDCDSIKQLYPYALATLTNSISANQIQILAYLTDKVIIAYDNDEAGKQGYWNAYNSLTKYGFKVKRFEHSRNVKDFGDMIEAQMTDPDMYEHLRHLYIKRLQELVNGF